jgi:hypothetical protein
MGVTTSYHVEATVNAWMVAAVNAATKPAWLPTIGVVLDWPIVPASMPCLSLNHLPVGMNDEWQGRIAGSAASDKGMRASALFEINAWVVSDNPNWMAQLRSLSDIVTAAALTAPTLPVMDYSVPDVPAATTYKVNLSDLRQAETGPDVNPAVQRRRWLLSYWWTFRG